MTKATDLPNEHNGSQQASPTLQERLDTVAKRYYTKNEAASLIQADLLGALPGKKHAKDCHRPATTCGCLYTLRNELHDQVTEVIKQYTGGTK